MPNVNYLFLYRMHSKYLNKQNRRVKCYDQCKGNTSYREHRYVLPKKGGSTGQREEELIYGYRPQDHRLWLLAPWFFVQWWKPYKLKAPSKDFKLTKWTSHWNPDEKKTPVPGIDFVIDEKAIAVNPHWIMLPFCYSWKLI